MSINSPAAQERLSAVVLVCGIVVFLGGIIRYSNQNWDDAFISYRFAEHLANGQGLTWNSGGAPTEGFTSLLQVLILSLGITLGYPPWSMNLAIGVISVFATIGMLVRVLRQEFGILYPTAAVVLALYLVDNITFVHTTSGLETPLFVALLCANYCATLSFVKSPRRWRAFVMAVLTLLAVLARPEAVLYGGVTYGALIVYYVLEPDAATKQKALEGLALSGMVVIVLGTLYAAWKLSYFGYLLPNTFYVKSNRLSLSGVLSVGAYIAHLTLWFAPVILSSVLFVPLGQFGALLRQKTSLIKVVLTFGPVAAALCYNLLIIHEQGAGYRFSYPTLFLIVLGVSALVSRVVHDAQPAESFRPRRSLVQLAYLGVLFILLGEWQITPLPLSPSNQYQYKIAYSLRDTGLGARATVLDDASGIIPYFSRFNQIDRVGLTDNYLSGRQPLTTAEREVYMWSSRPDVYIGYEPPAEVTAKRLEDDRQMHSGYVAQTLMRRTLSGIEDRIFVQDPQLLYARMTELRDNWLWLGEMEWPGWQVWHLKAFIYVRKDSPYAATLTAALNHIIAIEPEKVDLNVVE